MTEEKEDSVFEELDGVLEKSTLIGKKNTKANLHIKNAIEELKKAEKQTDDIKELSGL